jgi:hypothetical protein
VIHVWRPYPAVSSAATKYPKHWPVVLNCAETCSSLFWRDMTCATEFCSITPHNKKREVSFMMRMIYRRELSVQRGEKTLSKED